MQYELLIDPRDIEQPHAMVLLALRTTDRSIATTTAVRDAVLDTSWLCETESQFISGTGRDGGWILAYLPTGAVSDFLLSAELRGVALTLEPITDAIAAIERVARKARRTGGAGAREVQIWIEGLRLEVPTASAVMELVGEMCGSITGAPVYKIFAAQATVSRFPIPETLLAEWVELTAFSTARGQSPALCGA